MDQVKLLLGLVYLVGVTSTQIDYTGHQVLRVMPSEQRHLEALAKMEAENIREVRFWRDPRELHSPVDIHVPHDTVSRLETQGYLEKHDLPYSVLIEDVQDAINRHQQSNVGNKQLVFSKYDFSKYHPLHEIEALMVDLAGTYDGVSTFKAGESYEGRNIMGVKISKPGNGGAKKAIWIDGGIHCREWITSATVVYTMYQLLSQYGTNNDTTHILDNLDWYFLPVFNPDGYVYTWTTNRLWRKNRAPINGSNCTGTDLNRNFDLAFAMPGASHHPCNEAYHGTSAFSEVESTSVSQAMSRLKGSLVSYVNVHSYSQLWMTPWGYNKTVPRDFDAQNRGAGLAVKALEQVYGTKYKYGSIANVIYKASGNICDWVYAKAGATYSYAIELRDSGRFGFLLPAREILPTGKETFEGFKALAEYVIQQIQQ